MILRPLVIALFCAAPAIAQVSFGLIGGVPFNDLTNGSYSTADKSGRYTIGPTVQLGLPFGFRLEADALYRPLGIVGASTSQWRFPILAQYRFSGPLLKPFVEAGYSYDHVELNVQLSRDTPGSTGIPLSATSHHGFVVGAGVDFKVPFLRISPEIRYTHDTGAAKVGNLLNTDQAEFLVGIRF
jgi:opacity protein-like surface antigen